MATKARQLGPRQPAAGINLSRQADRVRLVAGRSGRLQRVDLPTADAGTSDLGFAADPDLAEVLRLHGEVLSGLRATLEYVVAAGQILLKKKKQYPGQYHQWVRAAGLHPRTAQRYVRYYQHKADIERNLRCDTGVASDTALQLKAGLESIAQRKLDGSPVTGADRRPAQPALPPPEHPITNNGEMVRDSITALTSQVQRIVAGTLSVGGMNLRDPVLMLRKALDDLLAALPHSEPPTPVQPSGDEQPKTLKFPFTHERIVLPPREKN